MSLALVGELDNLGWSAALAKALNKFDPAVITSTWKSTDGQIDASLIAKQVGSNGAAILGNIGASCSMLADALLKSGVHVMICDVRSCTSTEWAKLEQVASKQKQRLVCGSQFTRFNPIIYTESLAEDGIINIMVSNDRTSDDKIESTLAVPADIATAVRNSLPQVVFASKESDMDEKTNSSQSHYATVMMRFKGGITALISSSFLRAEMSESHCVHDAHVTVSIHGKERLDVDLSSLKITSSVNTSDELAKLREGTSYTSLDPIVDMIRYLFSGDSPQFSGAKWNTQIMTPTNCSRLARVMEAIIVSINTGAPIYIE